MRQSFKYIHKHKDIQETHICINYIAENEENKTWGKQKERKIEYISENKTLIFNKLILHVYGLYVFVYFIYIHVHTQRKIKDSR